MFVPVPRFLLSSAVATHCSIRRTTLHLLCPTIKALLSSMSLSGCGAI